MGLDVSFCGFDGGLARRGGGDRMRTALKPYVMHRADELDFLQLEVGDGVADVYLEDDSMLTNHVTGTDPWDLLVIGAMAADWVVLPTGYPACLTQESQRAQLPAELLADAVLVPSGAALLAVLLG